MRTQKLLILIILSFLVACNTNTKQESQKDPSTTEPTKISTSSIPDQSPSEQAKKTLRKFDEITNVHAINNNKKLLVALEVNQMDRFKLTKLRKKASAKLKKQFPDVKTELSTDKKLIIEVNKLEEEVKQKNITKQTLKKEIKHLIKLMKEKT